MINNMNKEFIIIDPRPLESFKDKTFSDFKKKDVFKKLFECLGSQKIEESCYWVTECIVSGYNLELFEKLIIYCSKMIHINNPSLPTFLWRRYKTFLNSFDHIDKKHRDQLIHLRNTQSVRNCFFDLVTTIIDSSTEKQFTIEKISDDDFQFTAIQNKLSATMQILPTSIIKFTDPEELRIIMNEFFFHLKNENGGYNRSCYWVTWLCQWEKMNKKKKIKFEIECRDISEVNPKYCKDCIWLLWEVIFEEANLRNDNIKLQIQSLYRMFRHNYTCGKRNTRLPLIFHAIGYLTYPLKNYKIRKDKNSFIQTQCNVNMMFKEKKNNEQTSYTPPLPKIKRIIGTDKEIAISKFNSLIDIDELNR